MRRLTAVIVWLAFALPAWGQGITLPESVAGDVAAFVAVPATTEGETVRWRAVDSGLNLFPVELLKDTRVAVVSAAKPGRYRLLAWTCVDGLPTEAAECVVVIGIPPLPPLPPDPPGPGPDPVTPPAPPTTEKATAATYVYEKDLHVIPNQVLSALNRLNRERRILATVLEADARGGTGDVPEQYKLPLAAAKEAGLPALVVTGGGKVLSVVKKPQSEQAVLDAVK